MKLRLILILLILSLSTSYAFGSYSKFEFNPAEYECSRELTAVINSRYDHLTMPGFKFRPGQQISYPKDSPYFSHHQRLKYALLVLQPDVKGEDLETLIDLLQRNEPHLNHEQMIAELLRTGSRYSPNSEITSALELHLPTIAQQNTGKCFQAFSGGHRQGKAPNCFQASLAWHFPDTKLEYVSRIDMETRLRHDFQRVPPESRLHLGDILAIWGESPSGAQELVHTALYINSQFIWHKPSRFIEDPWTFEFTADALEYYLTIAREDGIRLIIEYYRKP